MPVEIKVPSAGESVTEAILARWLKKDGEYVKADGGDYDPNNSLLLNTIGTAVGLTNAEGGPLDDFGDLSVVPRGLLDAIQA